MSGTPKALLAMHAHSAPHGVALNPRLLRALIKSETTPPGTTPLHTLLKPSRRAQMRVAPEDLADPRHVPLPCRAQQEERQRNAQR